MPRVRVDIQGQMTDLPPENIPQGASQELVNMRFKDGAWRPVATKKLEWIFAKKGETVTINNFFIHTVESYDIRVVYYGSYVQYLKIGTPYYYDSLFEIGADKEVKFSSFNEVLIIYNVTDGLTYVSKLEIDGDTYSYSTPVKWDITLPKLSFYSSYTRPYKTHFTVLENKKETAKDNFIQLRSEIESNNHFYSRVFVRYALKMFDGSYIGHSPIYPVYHDVLNYIPTVQNFGKDSDLISSSDGFTAADGSTPISNPFDVDDTVTFKHSITIYGSLLRFLIPDTTINNSLITNIKKYKDYIDSVDIFISKPDEIWDIDNLPIANELEGTASIPTNNPISLSTPNNSNDFEKLNNFFLFRSIPIDNLTTGTDEDLGFISQSFSENSSSRGQQQTGSRGTSYGRRVGGTSNSGYGVVDKTDTYDFIDLYSFTENNEQKFTTRKALPILDFPHYAVGNRKLDYNSRVFLGDVIERLFPGYPTFNLCDTGDATSGSAFTVHSYAYLETEEGERIVQSDSDYDWSSDDYKIKLLPFLTYPDIRCKKIAIYVVFPTNPGYGIKYEFVTKVHPYLNMAYAFTGTDENSHYNSWRQIDPYAATSPTALPTLTSNLNRDRNRLMVSRVNNPFVFPAEDTNRIGKNDIVGILTNSKQMSEGQFGIHPVIILTLSGIWALEISTGAIFTKNIVPVNNDECTGEAISFYSKSLDSDVIVYLSKTGVKMMQGTQVADITQFVKNDTYSVLDLMEKSGYTFHDPVSDASTLSIGEYAELTAVWSTYSIGDYILKTGTSTYEKIDKSYYVFKSLDDIYASSADESLIWTAADPGIKFKN